jgi:hypothetical protein
MRKAFGGDADQQPDLDSTAAETHIQKIYPSHGSLHNEAVFPDGAKGYEIYNNIDRAEGPTNISKSDWKAWYTYCDFRTLVRAKNIDSTAILTDNKQTIYTTAHFKIESVIKSSVPLVPNQVILTYRLGGQVQDGGETLRIVTVAPEYKVGSDYLLLLNADSNASTLQFAASDTQTVRIKNDRIYPVGEWAGFLSGTAYRDVEETFDRVSKIKACP